MVNILSTLANEECDANVEGDQECIWTSWGRDLRAINELDGVNLCSLSYIPCE